MNFYLNLADNFIIFEKDLEVKRILQELSLLVGRKIIPGQTLLFLDEIQVQPQAITALRYFCEQVPELHVVAAGSLLDFALHLVGMPVGRVQMFYLHPFSFMEFLKAIHEEELAKLILHSTPDHPIS